jgi:hypothetical protein
MNESIKAAKATEREQRVAALRDGRKVRGGRHIDRRKEASRKACRKGDWR